MLMRTVGKPRKRNGVLAVVLASPLAWAITSPALAGAPTVVDIGVESGFQDTSFGHYNRGRACVAADFDLDGWIDFYFGNVGDPSFVVRNTGPDKDGIVHFELVQTLLVDEVAWGAVALDYDDDDDYDIFITGGGNEAAVTDPRFCYLFRNLLSETGELQFEDVTEQAGVSGAVPAGETDPAPSGHANAVCGDYDQDGDVDILVSRRLDPIPNILWRNNGNGTFTDVTEEAGLVVAARSQNSTFVDVDNDGDLDLYENNVTLGGFGEPFSILWSNRLQETGTPFFVDVTSQLSAPGHDIGQPIESFVSAAADFNNDGRQDLVAFKWGLAELDPLYPGHALFLNDSSAGFANVANSAGLNDPFISITDGVGVMGCQLGDLNGDGVPDWFIGNGGPSMGVTNQLYLSDTAAAPVGTMPQFVNVSALIDFPAADVGGITPASYPYRTHGTNLVDVDNDGTLELAVANGGTSWNIAAREPNRLFKFTWDTPPNWLKVRPVGDGVCVSRDAIGTRISVVVREGAGPQRQVFNTLFGGSAFSAQQGFEVYFGLEQADTIESMLIRWPDGEFQSITEGLAINTSIVVEREPLVLGDLDCSGEVGFADLSILLAAWGPCPPTGGCPADLDGDGMVAFTDLTALLGNWGGTA
jgi:hypothetical protein